MRVCKGAPWFSLGLQQQGQYLPKVELLAYRL